MTNEKPTYQELLSLVFEFHIHFYPIMEKVRKIVANEMERKNNEYVANLKKERHTPPKHITTKNKPLF